MKKMSALLLALGFCALADAQEQASEPEARVLGKSYADCFSHKNVERIEKGSSLLALIVMFAGLSGSESRQKKAFMTAFGILAMNGVSNVALGCGYKKDKKALVRALIPITVIVPAMLIVYEYAMAGGYATRAFVVGCGALIVKECFDLYSVIKSYRSASSAEVDQIIA